MKKLRNISGETLVEALLSMLIILLSVLFLTNSVIAAQKINAAVRGSDTSFNYGTEEKESGEVSIKIGGRTFSVGVNYYTDNGYKYYSEN